MKNLICLIGTLIILILSLTSCDTTDNNTVINKISKPIKVDTVQAMSKEDSAFCKSVLDIISNTIAILKEKKNDKMIWKHHSSIGCNLVEIDNKLYEYFVTSKEFNTSSIFFRMTNINKNGQPCFPIERCIFEYNHSNNTFTIQNYIYEKEGQPSHKATDVVLEKERLTFFINKIPKMLQKL